MDVLMRLYCRTSDGQQAVFQHALRLPCAPSAPITVTWVDDRGVRSTYAFSGLLYDANLGTFILVGNHPCQDFGRLTAEGWLRVPA